MIQRIILYGSGKRCNILFEILRLSNIEIIAILDSDPNKWGYMIHGHKVESPYKIHELRKENICITIADFNVVKKIRKTLRNEYQYDLKKELHYNQVVLEAYKQNPIIKQYIIEKNIIENKKESLLFDCYNGLGLGGVEAWTMDLCKTLIEDGVQQTYIISDMGVYNIPHIIEKNIIYVEINHQEQFSISTILNLIKAIKKRLPCKVVTCTTNEVMLAAYLIKYYYPKAIEIISVIHNSNEKVYEDYMDFSGGIDFYISVSQDIRNNMIQQGGSKEIISSMNCPFACEPTIHRKYSDISMPIRIGYAGRIEYIQKRMDLLLELIRILIEKNIEFKMELVGDGSARSEMEEIVNGNKWCERVSFLGRIERSEISCFWSQQDICINIADFEGRSISIVEAMGNGVIPVVTATSGVREDITEGVNGYIVSVGDYQTMAKRIEDLSYHRERLYRMGSLAHDAVYPKSLMETHLKFWKDILL